MTQEQKEQRLYDRHGPVIASVSSASEPDKEYLVRYKGSGEYWCPCIGYQIRKHCRHARYCRDHGYASPLMAPNVTLPTNSWPGTSVVVQPDPTVAMLDKILLAGGVYATESSKSRMVAKLQTLLADYEPREAVTAGPARTGFGVRKIVLED